MADGFLGLMLVGAWIVVAERKGKGRRGKESKGVIFLECMYGETPWPARGNEFPEEKHLRCRAKFPFLIKTAC